MGELSARVTVDSPCFHGGRSGGPKGKRNDMYRHGLFMKGAITERKKIRHIVSLNIKRQWAVCYGLSPEVGTFLEHFSIKLLDYPFR